MIAPLIPLSVHRCLTASVELWHLPLPLPGAIDPSAWHLDQAERVRGDAYRRIEDRVRFAATRSALRVLLAERTGRNASGVTFSYNRYGKPFCSDYPQLFFNVAHSGDHALIAISSSGQVGVDIERIDQGLDWRALSAIACTEDERALIGRAEEGALAFFDCWVAKEAILKASGVGVGEHLQAVSIDVHTREMQRVAVGAGVTGRAHEVLLDRCDAIPGYAACLAHIVSSS